MSITTAPWHRTLHPVTLSVYLAALALTFAAAGLWSPASAAQAVCVPDAPGVPGQWGEPPDWSTPAASPTVEGHRDPRWNGALGVGHNGGEAHVRVLRKDVSGQRYLYVSLHATADPKASDFNGADGDRVVIGIGSAGGALGYLITLRVDTTSATNDGKISFDGSATPPWNGRIMVESFKEWTGPPSYRPLTITVPPRPILPPWLVNDTKLFVTCRLGDCINNGSDFNVQLRIPVGGPHVDTSGTLTDASFAGGLEPNGDLSYFQRLDTHFNDVVTGSHLTRYAWPERLTPFGVVEPEPEPQYWASVAAGSATPCAGTIGFEGHNQIATGNTPPTKITPTTTFHARPRNSSGSPVNPSHLKVQFRMADWGSALFSSPQWNTVCDSFPGDAGTTLVPSGSELDLACANPSAFPICDYIDDGACAGPPPPTHSSHQCLLAQLSSASPPDAGALIFGRESYWNNMDMRESSVVEEDALIATHGLAPLGSARDVYLYVEKHNMPAAPASGGNGNNDNTDSPAGAAAAPASYNAALDPKDARDYQSGDLTPEQADDRLPTYRVHVFHDSGAKSDGGARLLVPAPSFGHYLYHQGDFLGWRDQLSGANLTQLSPTLYKLQMGNDAVATIKVRVESVDGCVERCQGAFFCELACQFPYWWILALGLVLLFIIVVLLRRRT